MNPPEEQIPTVHYSQPGPVKKEGGAAIASFVLGIISLVMWLCPLIGFPVSIPGIILGAVARRDTPESRKARIGLILSIIGFVLTAINSAVGAYLGATGRL